MDSPDLCHHVLCCLRRRHVRIPGAEGGKSRILESAAEMGEGNVRDRSGKFLDCRQPLLTHCIEVVLYQIVSQISAFA